MHSTHFQKQDNHMYACNCHEWHLNWPKLQTTLIYGWSQGISYSGAAFKNCPWCGEKLKFGILCSEDEQESMVEKETLEASRMGYARVYP